MSVQSTSEQQPEPRQQEMEPRQREKPSPVRVGDRDRDAVVQRLQQAFAEGRLDDDEFDQRTRAALTARLSGDLAVLTQDLPETAAAPRPAAATTSSDAAGPRTSGSAIAYKNSVRRAGRWRVPEHFRAIVYKGSGHIDLRAAELTAHETTLAVIAYKSRVDVLVPLGVRMSLEGFGVTKGWSAAEDLEDRLPPDAPVVHVRGIAYKGTIEVSTKPRDTTAPERRGLR